MLTVLTLFMFFGCRKASDEKGNDRELINTESEKTDAEIQADAREYLISESQVGSFEIGADIPGSSGLYQITKTRQVRTTEEGPVEEPTYRVSAGGKDMLVLKPQYDHKQEGYNNKIGEIMVLSGKYKTGEGIGVGSTVGEFKQAYPDFEMWYTYVSGRYIMEAAKLSIQFMLHEEDFIGDMNVNSVRVTLQEDDFRADAKIAKIRVFK